MYLKISCCVLLSVITPAILYETDYKYARRPLARSSGPDGLMRYHNSYYSPSNSYDQYKRPVRSVEKQRDQAPSASNMMMQHQKRTQRAPSPKYSKFTLDDVSVNNLYLPHGFQNQLKPTGFQHGNGLFSGYKYSPAIGHLPLNSLASLGYYGGANSNRGPLSFPEDDQTDKPIEEPIQEVPITPVPVSELTKASIQHQHMFTVGSTTAKPVQALESSEHQNVEYEVKYVPVYVDEHGKEVSSNELSNYRLKYEVESNKYAQPTAPAIIATPQPSYGYKYGYTPATSYKYEAQKFIPQSYEHNEEKDYPHYAPKYEFGYRVHDSYTGSDFGQSEHRDGEVTKGSYHVLLPDGRHQTVNYWSDESGFHAKVKYDGIAKHYPAPHSSESSHGSS